MKTSKACLSAKKGLRKKLNFKFLFSSKYILFFGIIFAVSFLMIYLIQVNKVATTGFEIRALEDQITELNDENRELELQLVELRSMKNLSKKITDLNLVDANDISYINISGPTVAQR